ncbi:MAG: hypothetical protein EOP64_11640 [Sphingomonas sp.]|nr:MAG: hypothetical protein EOP64_11640 [Sphingomonas sp.]
MSLFGSLEYIEGTDDHATDDHGGSSGHGVVSLFGSLEYIEGKMLMVGILIVVGAVLCLETLFHFLHSFTAETPFHDVVSAIEKELMVVGCTAFILKIVINTQTSMSHDLFFALEFADLLVPLFSFANCFVSLALILLSLRQCDAWRKAYHLKLEEILDEFVREDGNYFYM